ncbi:hypothetical protein CPC08DRAFT_820057 [Agrocybe pediades]|nr:hypothetical protein CPC08DRAFT_820057 [Agrocybe pediades]
MSGAVFVDDTDPGITYSGPWFAAEQGSFDAFGNFGSPNDGTLHGINSSGAFSYTFIGSNLLIGSTIQFPTVGGVTNPSWQCIVDGQALQSVTYTFSNNRLRICEQDGLNDNPHTVTVKVDVADNHTFWLDTIEFVPFPDTPVATAKINYGTTVPAVLLGLQQGNWTSRVPGYYTQQSGPSFTYGFYGVSILWRGFYFSDLPTDPTTATYSIDGQAPVSFDLNGNSAKGPGHQYSQVFFQTPLLEPNNHTLTVSYQGDSTKTPLALESLEVQNGISTSSTSSTAPGQNTVSSTTPTSTSPGNSASSTAMTTAGKKKFVSIGPIIGGVVGGIGLILIIVAIVIVILKKRSLNRRHGSHLQTAQVVHPFPFSETRENSTTQTEPPLSPVRSPYFVPPLRKNASGASNDTASPNSSTSPPRAHTAHAQGAQSLSTLSYTRSSDQDQAGVRRDLDSGLRFRSGDELVALQPPRYTAE